MLAVLNSDLRLEWLVSFLAVVESGGFSAAAEATHRSQPRVSMHVASLERAAGVALLDRRKRPVELTDAGASLAEHARRILRDVEAAEVEMSTWRGGARGVVHLGSYPSASAAFIPPFLRKLSADAPDITVSLVEMSTLELDMALRTGEVDLCLRPTTPPPVNVDIRSHAMWREGLVAVIPQGHELAEGEGPLAVADLRSLPLISIGRLDSEVPPSFEAHQLFREKGFELEPVQATNQPQTLVSMVRSGLGIGITNALAAHTTDTTGICIRPLAGDGERVVGVCWNVDAVLSPAARTVLAHLLEAPLPPGTTPVAGDAGRRAPRAPSAPSA